MLSARLCPGTFSNVFASLSFEIGARGVDVVFSTACPALNAAALVVRGTISGFPVVAGTARARNSGFPFPLSFPCPLLPPTVDGFVALDGAYPSSDVARRSAESTDDDTERMDP